MKKILFISLLIAVIAIGCSGDVTPTTDFKKEVPKTVTQQLILPRLEMLVQKTTDLKTAIRTFSTNSSVDNLKNAQEKLTAVTELYAKMYAFNIGAAKNKFMNRKINFWPVFNISIEKNIQSGTFTKESILDLGSAAKNLPGLNYLLFKSDTPQAIIAEYTANANRGKFLTLVVNEFYDNIQQLQQIWSSNGQNYTNAFITNEATGLESSFNLLFNGLYNVVDNCKVTKVGKPGGLEKSQHTNPEIVENFYAANSLQLVYNNLESVEEVFFSAKITNISEYIKSITKNDELNNKIQQKITTAKNLIKSINIPLKKAVDQDKENVKKLHTTLEELLVLLHNDARSVLSIIITGTDNDGD